MSSPYDVSDELPVYVISVAAQLSGMHPQTLRHYERIGLVSPGRSAGRGRRQVDNQASYLARPPARQHGAALRPLSAVRPM